MTPRVPQIDLEHALTSTPRIPRIDIGALFDGPSPARERTDAALMAAATSFGFFVAHGLPPDLPMDAGSRADLLRVFLLLETDIRPLWRQKFDSSHANVYRGWFPLQAGFLTSKEGIDMGADVAYARRWYARTTHCGKRRRCRRNRRCPVGMQRSRATIGPWSGSARF